MQNKVVFVIFCLVFYCFFISADTIVKVSDSSQEIKAEFKFDRCVVNFVNEKYSSITMGNLPLLTSPGKPALPFYSFRILLAPDKTIQDMEVIGKKEKILDPGVKIRPAGVPIPFFLQENRGKLATENEAYLKDEFFPGKLYSKWILTPLAGYRIANFNIYPVQYNPSTGKICYYPQLTIRINLTPSRNDVRVRPDFEKEVSSIVCNPDAVRSYQSREYVVSAERETPYVIITAKSLLNLDVTYNFEYFVNFLKSKGVNASIVTVEDIYNNYQGKDKAEQVRNFIRYAFEKMGTKYVLLGGDGDKGSELVPVRRFKTYIHYVYSDGTSLTVNEMMAADYYYSALDGDFDSNKNGYYGEPEDEIDLEPEVAVGRAPVDNKTQVNNFVKKTILAYNYAEQAATPKVLMVGEHLFSPGQCGVDHNIYGDWFMNELLLGSNTHNFHTYGFSDKWANAKLYDKDKTWSGTDAKQALSNSGACWVNHIGHSSPSYNMRLSTSSIPSLSNQVPFLYYSQGCNAARFTNEPTAPYSREDERYSDCIAEALVYSDYGAFAVIANWSYGLSPEDPETSAGDTPGASQYFHRWFVDAFFNPAVNMARIGDMMAYSKRKMNPWLIDPQMQTQTVRWVYYEVNLLGDPYAPLPKK